MLDVVARLRSIADVMQALQHHVVFSWARDSEAADSSNGNGIIDGSSIRNAAADQQNVYGRYGGSFQHRTGCEALEAPRS